MPNFPKDCMIHYSGGLRLNNGMRLIDEYRFIIDGETLIYWSVYDPKTNKMYIGPRSDKGKEK